MELVTIQSYKHLEIYQHEWSTILQTRGNKNPFLEYEFFSNWWKSFGHSKEIIVYAVKENTRIIAFFPFQKSLQSNVTIFQFAGFPQALFGGVVIDSKNIDRVFMYLFDTLITTYKHCIFELEGFIDHEQASKLSTYLLARNSKKKITESTIPSLSTPLLPHFSFSFNKERRLIESMGELVIRQGELKDIQAFLVETPVEEQQLLWNLAKEGSHRFRVHIQLLQHHEETIAFSYGLVCRGEYVGYEGFSQNEFKIFQPERILLEEKVLKNQALYSTFYNYSLPKITNTYQTTVLKNIAFSSGTFLARFVLKNRKFHVTRLPAKVEQSPQQLGKLNKKQIMLARLSGIKLNVRNHYKKFSSQEYQGLGAMENRKYILSKIANGYEGFYDKQSNHCFWVNQQAIILDNYYQTLEEHSVFLLDWEQEDLEKILSFVQSYYQPRHIYLTVRPKDKINKKKLKLFGFQM